MSVNAEVVLPAQPTTGSVRLNPLGGDGWTSPQAVYTLDMESTGDASAGSHKLEATMDTQFCALCSHMMVGIQTVAADVAVRLTLHNEDEAPAIVNGVATYQDVGLSAGSIMATAVWIPPPMFLVPKGALAAGESPSITAHLNNVNGQVVCLRARIYLFQKRAPERTPLAQLLASVPSGMYFA